MIKGMSSEKPADVRFRWMERIWSVYEVRGEKIRLLRWKVSAQIARGLGEKTYKRGVKAEINVATNAMMDATRSCNGLDR